jgi:hypothetical protein
VGVEPEPVHLHAARDVELPDPLQRQLGQEVLDRLAAVQRVGEDVVQVEEDAAVAPLGDETDELAVVELVGTRP